MNDCYLNFLVSFRALFSLDVGANLVNSKQNYWHHFTRFVVARICGPCGKFRHWAICDFVCLPYNRIQCAVVIT